MIYFLAYFLFLIFNLSLINLSKADEAAALCAFIAATNVSSFYNQWNCDNTANRCSNWPDKWPGINCQNGKITKIILAEMGISGKYYKIKLLNFKISHLLKI